MIDFAAPSDVDSDDGANADQQIHPLKIVAHMQRVERILREGRCSPICLEIHPTNVCNLACKDCATSTLRSLAPARAIHSQTLFTALQHFRACEGKSTLWSGGGDPSLYRCQETGAALEDALRHANELGLEQGVYTNGALLDESLAATIVNTCRFIRFSLDAFSSDTYEDIHGRPLYGAAITSLKRLLLLRQHGQAGTTVGVSFVVREDNLRDLQLLPQWIEDVGPDYVYVKPLERGPGYGALSSDAATRILRQLRELSRDMPNDPRVIIPYSSFARLLQPDERKRTVPCYIALLVPTLAADARLYTCCHHVGCAGSCLGAVEHASLPQILERAKIIPPEKLVGCPANCRGQSVNEQIRLISTVLGNPHRNFL